MKETTQQARIIQPQRMLDLEVTRMVSPAPQKHYRADCDALTLGLVRPKGNREQQTCCKDEKQKYAFHVRLQEGNPLL